MNGEKRFADPIDLRNQGMASEIKQFITSTSYLLSRMLGVGIPPEDKVDKIADKILEDELTLIEPFKFREKVFQDIEELKIFITKNANNPSLERLVSSIDFNSGYKDLKGGIISFLHSASCLRSANFRLKALLKYKIERLVYEVPISFDSVSSISACLATIEISKYVSVAMIDSRASTKRATTCLSSGLSKEKSNSRKSNKAMLLIINLIEQCHVVRVAHFALCFA